MPAARPSRPSSGWAAPTAAHAAASSVMQTSVGGVRRRRRGRPVDVEPVGPSASSSSSSTLRRTSERAADEQRRRRAPRRSAWRSRQPGSSCTAWCRPSSSRTRSSTSWAKRSVSLAPTLTSVARATARRGGPGSGAGWSAVAADSCLQPVGAGQLALDRRDGGVEVLASARRRPAPAACRAASAARVGSRRRMAASISWPRLATGQPSARPASRRAAMSCRRSRSGPGVVARTVSVSAAGSAGRPARTAATARRR